MSTKEKRNPASFTFDDPYGVRPYTYVGASTVKKGDKWHEAYQVRIPRGIGQRPHGPEEEAIKTWLSENQFPAPGQYGQAQVRISHMEKRQSGIVEFRPGWICEFIDFADALAFWLRFCQGVC